ncbi:MAG: hypothetical protein CMJ76_12370 [Planctomycetaceae bacterium]|nr:hypothetical protein [Planctomycetaceae bacterium]
MAISTNDFCPCGSGDKIRFCCGSDMAKDLEKLSSGIEGEQYIATLKKIDGLIEEKGNLGCLLALRGIALMATGQIDEAQQNALEFLDIEPENSTAWAQRAITSADEPHKVMEYVQRCLEHSSTEQIPQLILPAIQGVTDALFASGNLFAAFSHLTLASAISRGNQQAVMRMFQFVQNPDYPLLLKQRLPLPSKSDDVPYAKAYDEISELSRRGAWFLALDQAEDLLEQNNGDQTLLKAIAVLNTYLGQDEGAEAWREYITTIDSSSDDAIEAEAYAQMLENQSNPDVQPINRVSYNIADLDKVQELLVASDQARLVPSPDYSNEDPENPPPRNIFVITDRPQPESGAHLTLEEVPKGIASIYLFGKQTDREARIELVPSSIGGEQAAGEILADIANGNLGKPDSTEEISQVPVLTDAMAWNPVFPDDTPQDKIQALSLEHRHTSLLETFPKIKLAALDDMTPEEASVDFEARIKLDACLLIIESNLQCRDHNATLNEVRTLLSLKPIEAVDPTDVDLDQIPDIRLARYDVKKLSTQQLGDVYQRCFFVGFRRGFINAAREIIERDEKPEHVNMPDVYAALLESLDSIEGRLELVEQAKAEVIALGESPAAWLLREIPLRLMNQEAQTASNLIRKLETDHINEPGIAEQLYGLLVQMGVMNPDGTRATSAGPSSGQSEGGIWTPGSDSNNDADSEGSGLWIPD